MLAPAGDLAKKKIFPALFAIFYEGMMPKHFHIYGFARSNMSDDEFRDLIAASLTCRVDQKEDCGDKMDYFLDRCFYQPGQYGSEEDFQKLSDRMTETEQVTGPLQLSGSGSKCIILRILLAINLHRSTEDSVFS